MTAPRPRVVLVAALLIFACRVSLALAIVPPWQNPDEFGHVAYVESLRTRLDAEPRDDPAREADILMSMATYRWWEHYGRPTPAPMPPRFVQLPPPTQSTLGLNPTLGGYPPPYYFAAAELLRLAPSAPVVNHLYVMRLLAAALGLGLVALAWFIGRQALGDAGAVVPLLVALHPQLLVVATTAGPDMIAIVAGTVLWGCAVQLHLGRRRGWSFTGMWAAAAVAAFTDRSGVPLLGVALVISATLMRRRSIGVPVVIAGALATAVAFWVINQQTSAFRVFQLSDLRPVDSALTWAFAWSFSRELFETWWFALGWLRYRPEAWWMLSALSLSAAAAIGVVRARRRGGDAQRAVIDTALIFLAVQLAGILWVFYRSGGGAQGRYLFTALIATLALVWVGVDDLCGVRRRRVAAIGLVLAFALLDSAAWVLVAAPAYFG